MTPTKVSGFWSHAMDVTTNLKNDDGTYKDNPFQKVCNTFFNFVTPKGCLLAAGNCLLHYMDDDKNNYHHISPQHFLLSFPESVCAIGLVNSCYNKELNNTKARIFFFYSCPQTHIRDYIDHSNSNIDNDTLEDLINFSGSFWFWSSQEIQNSWW